MKIIRTLFILQNLTIMQDLFNLGTRPQICYQKLHFSFNHYNCTIGYLLFNLVYWNLNFGSRLIRNRILSQKYFYIIDAITMFDSFTLQL